MNGTIIRIVPGSPDGINVMEIRKIDHTSSELLDMFFLNCTNLLLVRFA